MPTFPDWEATVLDHVYEDVDYLSLHQYLGDTTNDLGDYLAKSLTTEHFIHSVVSTCDYVKARKRSKKNMMLSFDEWNIWYHSVGKDDDFLAEHPWEQAPSLVEDIYTAADAVVFGSMLITLLRHADRVKIACLAQLVNVIAPIMTERGGGTVWKQTIYYPFAQATRYGHGRVLLTQCASGCYDGKTFTDVPYLEAVAVENEKELTIFAVNRSQTEALPLRVDLRAFGACRVLEHSALWSENPYATNGPGQEVIVPRSVAGSAVDGGSLQAVLPPMSWNTIRLRLEGQA